VHDLREPEVLVLYREKSGCGKLACVRLRSLDGHSAAVALYTMYYNFGRKHQTLGTTPAVKAGIADHIWSVEAIDSLLEEREMKAAANSN